MDNLDLSDWDLEEKLIEVEVNRRDNRRVGVLVDGMYVEHVEHPPQDYQEIVVDGRVINSLSGEGNTHHHHGWNQYMVKVTIKTCILGRDCYKT